MMLVQLINALRDSGFSLDSEELADILWLARQLPEEKVIEKPSLVDTGREFTHISKGNTLLEQPPLPQFPTSVGKQVQSRDVPARAGLFIPPESTETSGGLHFGAASVSALPNKLAYGRALRPLLRKVPSQNHYVLDVEATVHRIADTQVRLPVMRPEQSRWLELDLVVDEWSSIVLWRDEIRELIVLLTNLGAFRSVQVWSLWTTVEGTGVELHNGWGAAAQKAPSRPLKELISIRGNRLILVLSDAISPAWYNGTMGQTLKAWMDSEMVVLLHLLPYKFWPRTGLVNAVPVYFRFATPGQPNAQLSPTPAPDHLEPLPSSGFMPLPVLPFDPSIVAAWAQASAGRNNIWVPGMMLPLTDQRERTRQERLQKSRTQKTVSDSQAAAGQMVERFRQSASPYAWKLAGYLSATVPLNLPLMRLVQRVMLPDSQPEHLAEFYLSGLIRRQDPLSAAGEKRTRYEFVPDVRLTLLSSITRDEAAEVIRRTSLFISRESGKTIDFDTLVADPSLAATIDQESTPFAEITQSILRVLGGEYTRLADALVGRFVQEEQEFEEVQEVGKTEELPNLNLPHAFISYSRRDIEIVDRIVKKLSQDGIDVWIDRESIKGGNLWRERIIDAIDSCGAFVLVLSPNSANSDNVRKEIDLAEGSGRTLFPFMLEPVKLPDTLRYQLAGIQLVDVQKLGFENAISVLTQAVKEHLATSERAKERLNRQVEVVIKDLNLSAFSADNQEQLLDFVSELTGVKNTELDIKQIDQNTLSTKKKNRFLDFISKLTGAKRPEESAGKPISPQFFEPETIQIWAGPFLMGSTPGRNISIQETPQHEVFLPAYRIGKFPVTNAQYEEFVRQTRRIVPSSIGWNSRRVPEGRENHPVLGVSWYDALEYCRWLSEKTGRKYSLPSEAQWEKACRGDISAIYPWGDRFDSNRCNQGRADVAPVDAYPAQNNYGCYDFVGNVRQWTTTLWGEKRLAPDPNYAYPWKDDRRNDLNAGRHICRVVRGSSFKDDRQGVRCSVRNGQLPDSSVDECGFRVVINLDKEDVSISEQKAKIFLSYKRNAQPDQNIAEALYKQLSTEGHDVFMDTTIQVGEKWAERIQKAIKESDYLIALISANSVHSEMVIAEIETANHQGRTYGKPVILPVRLNYSEPLIYPLSAYLNPLQWARWDKDSDTPSLIAELKQAIAGEQLLPHNAAAFAPSAKVGEEEIPTAFSNANIPSDFGSPEGTVPHQSPFYIERATDVEAMDALREIEGVTITIKGPRQMGKSSLLNRLLTEGKSRGMRTAFIDFQLIENVVLENADIFYKEFCSLLSWEFDVEDRTEEFWKNPLGHVQKTTNYLQRHMLKEIKDVQILLIMDEVERMFGSPFRSDFFSMLRSWHNNRARGGDWTRFNMALATSTEPYQFIADLNQSPFNVGQVVELEDFTLPQVNDLNNRFPSPLAESQVKQLFVLLGGHPYLTQRAFYLIASQRDSFAELIRNASEDNGPFGDHLRNCLFRMKDQKNLQTGLVQVIRNHRISDEHIFFQLRGAGLVKRIDDRVVPRNQLYADYFSKHLEG